MLPSDAYILFTKLKPFLAIDSWQRVRWKFRMKGFVQYDITFRAFLDYYEIKIDKEI